MAPAATPDQSPRRHIRLGISACLLGDEVRYDGGHKRSSLLIDLFGPFVEWVKVCPEVEVGMGTPREPIHLVDEFGTIHLQGVTTGTDHTASMTAYAARKAEAIACEDLCGFILKADSPTCGIDGVTVHNESGATAPTGAGLFAQALRARLPDLPIEDERRLADPQVRERFLARVLAYRPPKP
jgi:uncharacterized protein YbbK (DUF523 family)